MAARPRHGRERIDHSSHFKKLAMRQPDGDGEGVGMGIKEDGG